MYEGYRKLELLIGPFKEWEGKKLDTNAISIVSTGSVDTLKISASISKEQINPIQISTINIWNLKKDTVNRLREPGLSIKLLAGYEDGNMETLFAGGIAKVQVVRQGADRITKLTCMLGKSNLMRSVTSKTYAYGTKIKTIVQELAQSIPGITVDNSNINVEGSIGTSGWSYVGSTEHALNRLGQQYSFSWNINNEIFSANTDGKVAETAIVLNEDSGLVQVSPQLYGPFLMQVGVNVESLYVQGIYPGKGFLIQSKENPNMDGKYTANTINYELCPKTNQWNMTISSLYYM